MAMRFLSRAVNSMTGSIFFSLSRWHRTRAAARITALWLSPILMASTWSLTMSTVFRNSSVFTPLGGVISQVMTNRPFLKNSERCISQPPTHSPQLRTPSRWLCCLLGLFGLVALGGLGLLWRGLYPQPLGRVIPAQVEVEPGRGSHQFPVARRSSVVPNLPLFLVFLQPLVGSHPDALLVRVDFAPPFISAPAGPVSLILGALRHGAQEGDVEQGAVSAVHHSAEGPFAQ